MVEHRDDLWYKRGWCPRITNNKRKESYTKKQQDINWGRKGSQELRE